MPRSSRQKSRRSHKHGEGKDRSASEDDGALKDRKPRVEESRVSEPEKRKSSSSLQPSKDKDKDPMVTSNGDLSGEHGRKRKDRAEDSAVAVVDDRWNGGAEDEHVGDKKPKAEGFEAVELEKAGRSKASGGELKSRSSRRQDGSSERIEEVGGKQKSEKDLSRRDSTGSQHKNFKEKEKDYSKDTKERDKDNKDSKERGREYIKDAKEKDREYTKDAKEKDREYTKDAKERDRDHPRDAKEKDRDHPRDAKEKDRDHLKDAKERDRDHPRDAKERDKDHPKDAKERDREQLKDAKERDAKERVAKERDTKERDSKERVAKERDSKERVAKERDTKERDSKERDAKEKDVKERDAKERDAKERDKDHHRDVKDRDRDYYKEDRDRDYYKDAKDRDRENYKDSKERDKDYSKDARERDRDYTKDTKERDKDYSKDTRERDRDYYKDARERDRDYSKDARERDRDRGTERDKRVQDTRHERTDDAVSRKPASKINTSGEEHGTKKNIENSGGKAQEGVRNPEPEKELDKSIRRRDGSGDKGKYPGDGRDSDDRRLSSRDDHTRNSNHKDESQKEGRYRDRYKEELDRDQRDRDDRGRDERTSRDHNSSKSGNKHFRDENRLPEGHYKKSKIQDTDHDTCPHIDDHGTKLKDNRGIDLKPRGSKEVHEDVEKNASSTSKFDPHSDRGRLDYVHADKVDSSMGSNRRKSSPSSGNHTMRDQFRASSKQGGSSGRKPSSEEKQRLNTATRGDNVAVPGVHERDSESRSLERRKPKEGVRMGEVEPTAPHYDKTRSDARHSSNSLVQKSPSTGSDRRFPDKIGARRSFDTNSSKHGRDFPNTKDRDRDRGFEKVMSNDFYRGEMFDSEPIPTSFNRTSHLSGSSPSHLPPPPSSGHGTGSPSVLGSYEDDNRNQLGDRKPNNRFRRSGEHAIGRGQGNSWKSPATWQSPVPNGFISLQHGPPHPGYHPGVQQFPSPLYGVRPSLELNHTGVSYHMHEAADRFSNHGRPFGWHNPMDDCPPPLPVWDARNGGVFGDESHAYGRPEWDVNRQLMSNRGWEMTADMWKGQNGNMNMELPMPQDSDYSACSEAWTGQTGPQSRKEKDPSDCLPTVSSDVKHSNDRSPAKDGIENFQKNLHEKTSELSKPTVPDTTTTTGNEDSKILLCCNYLSKIDISLDLARPGLYQECKFLLGSRDKAGVYNNMIKKENGQSTQGDPTVAVPSRNNILSSVFPLSADSVFQRAMSLYKKHGNGRKVNSSASPSSCPEDKASSEVSESQKPAGEDMQTISADSPIAEVVMVADNQTSDDTPANVDSTNNFVEEKNTPTCPEGFDSDEAMDQQSDTPDAVISVEGSQSCETIMAECRVNVSRIHLSPGSTH